MRTHRAIAVFALVSGLASAPAEAAPARLLPTGPGWFYANARGDRIELSPDGHMGGEPVWRTGVVLARVHSEDGARALSKFPGARSVEAIDPAGRILRLDFGAEADDLAASRALFAREDVVWAHPDLAFRPTPHAFPNDPYVDAQWHLENIGQSGGTVDADIDAEAAWALSTGAGVRVSVVDSGVDPDHPDLRVTCGHNYIEDNDECFPADLNAHGTSAAGLVAAIGDNGVGVAGVAWEADIYGVRLIGGSTTFSDVYQSFVESVDAGAAVINNSWGYGDGCGNYALPGALEEGFVYADTVGRNGLGTVIVFSAGNGDCDMSNDGVQSHPTVVSVAALNRHDEKESYSSYGRNMDISGPSGGLLTTDITGPDGYGDHEGDADYTPGFSGTSASAPVVSGVFALMFAANPDLTADDARAVIEATADKVQVDSAEYDSSGWSRVYGYGRVNAAAAVVAVANTGPEAPEPTGPTGDPYADRVVLQWSPATDPDGDPLRYRVTLTLSAGSGDTGAPVETAELDPTSDTFVDITSLVIEGQEVHWSVRAEDAWTASEPAEGNPFEVLPIPEPPPEDSGTPPDAPAPTDTAPPGDADPDPPAKGGAGCSTIGGSAATLAWLALAAVARRSRPQHVPPGEVDPRSQHLR